MEQDQDISQEEQMMAAYILHKHDWIKNVLFAPVRSLYLHFEDEAALVLATELCIKLKVSPDMAFDFVTNSINIQDLM